jgi:lysozyme family protein
MAQPYRSFYHDVVAAVPPSYRSKWPTYSRQWDAMLITRVARVRAVAKRLHAAKDRYLKIEKATGVPWWMVAVIHERESSQNWSRSLAQGDPWNRVSVHVPGGRGPFRSWEEAAIDALATLKRLHKITDWRLEKVLYQLERYNGWGYHWRDLASPYLWGGTTIQQRGKFVADGKFSPTRMDGQLGCAGMIYAMMDLDPSIQPIREK